MISEEIKSIKSEKKDLQQFALIIGILLSLLGTFLCRRSVEYYWGIFVVSLICLFVGLVSPRLLRPLYTAWMTVGILMGWIMTKIILAILFYLIVTPMGLSIRFMGKDLLDLEISDDDSTYWVTKKKAKRQKSDYENQF